MRNTDDRASVVALVVLSAVVWCSWASGRVQAAQPANVKPVAILNQLDIDGDGLPDGTPDTDGDGLPDNWEAGGPAEAPSMTKGQVDRQVLFSAPTAIGPGTPPTFVLNRQGVTTDATKYDTDGDGLSDFVEVFGLKYIDDNGNGKLDFIYDDANGNGHWDPGEKIDPRSEWMDLNGDGLPSIGEWPLPNLFVTVKVGGQETTYTLTDEDGNGKPDHFVDGATLKPYPVDLPGTVVALRPFDFDGFVFTDPTNADTDGDGLLDGEDPDPLINPKTFAAPRGDFVRIKLPQGGVDLDNDGLGNGADFGNDITGKVDNPEDIARLMKIFRPDLYGQKVVPESLIEDLIGADWDGNGLWRITDVVRYKSAVTSPDAKYFYVGSHPLFAAAVQGGASPEEGATAYGVRHEDGMGYQELLKPAGPTEFMPDVRVWTILYAWRVPGFDIDGNGFTGSPESNFAGDDRHGFDIPNKIDGQIDTPPWLTSLCGAGAGQALVLTLLGFAVVKVTVAPRMRRRQQ